MRSFKILAVLDRDWRYRSAAGLAAGIRRHRRSEPITARPVTALYQLGKFARRNKGLVGGIAAAFASQIPGTIVSLWQAGVAIE